MAIFRLQRLPVTYVLPGGKVLKHEYPYPVPVGRNGIARGHVMLVDMQSSFRYFYVEDADSYSLEMTQAAVRAYEMAGILSMPVEVATEYTMLSMEPQWPSMDEPISVSKDGIWGQGKVLGEFTFGKKPLASIPNQLPKNKYLPDHFSFLKEHPEHLTGLQKLKKDLEEAELSEFVKGQIEAHSPLVPIAPNAHFYVGGELVSVPTKGSLKPGDAITLQLSEGQMQVIMAAGHNTGKSSLTLAMLGQKLKQDALKGKTQQAIILDSLDFESTELKILSSMSGVSEKDIKKQLDYATLYGGDLKGFLNWAKVSSMSAHYPPEPPKQGGVIGKGLPANLGSLKTGHFQSKKEKTS